MNSKKIVVRKLEFLIKNKNYKTLIGLECYEIKKKLSKREYEIFGQLGVSNDSNLIANNLNISRKTIDNHIEKIKKKKKLISQTQHGIRTGRRITPQWFFSLTDGL